MAICVASQCSVKPDHLMCLVVLVAIFDDTVERSGSVGFYVDFRCVDTIFVSSMMRSSEDVAAYVGRIVTS